MLVCAVPKVVGYKLDLSPVMNYLGLLCGRVASGHAAVLWCCVDLESRNMYAFF